MSDSKKKSTPKKSVAKKKQDAPKKEAPAPKKEVQGFKTPEEFHKAKNELKAKHLKGTPNLWTLGAGNAKRDKYEKELAALKALRSY
tara:strand:+ start:445 stop:705 length:261 start_codon:yes stop_codon:yes gene_type:complete